MNIFCFLGKHNWKITNTETHKSYLDYVQEGIKPTSIRIWSINEVLYRAAIVTQKCDRCGCEKVSRV